MGVFRLVTGAAILLATYGTAVSDEIDASILSAATSGFSATSEIEAFVCAYNGGGGMMTEIVETALSAAGQKFPREMSFLGSTDSVDLDSIIGSGGVLFPMYKPKCDDAHILNDHTKQLCNGYKWSEPLFHVITAGYVAASSDWHPRNGSDLMGRTICQVNGEVAHFVKERGLTDLNARLITAGSTDACLSLVATGESDIAILPMIAVDSVHRTSEHSGPIRHVAALDRVLSVHAIASLKNAQAVADIYAIDAGLNTMRADGRWFEIVTEHYVGHDHDHDHHGRIAAK